MRRGPEGHAPKEVVEVARSQHHVEHAVGEAAAKAEAEADFEAVSDMMGVEEGAGAHEGGGEHEAAGHGHGEHEEPAGPVDIAISGMLCGSVSFVMMLFYIVNYDDTDIRFYAWSVISSTLSIFLAVLLFHAIKSTLELELLHGVSAELSIAAHYGHMIFWLLMLHCVFVVISGTVKVPFAVPSKKRALAACWGKLITHMAAFSSIIAGGTLQQTPFFSSSPVWAAALVPAHLCALLGALFLLRSAGRLLRKPAGSPDDEANEAFRAKEMREAENEVMALSLSFLAVQALRFALTGILPNTEGHEEPMHIQPFACSLGLLAASIVCAALVSASVIAGRHFHEGSGQRRAMAVLQTMAAMAMAWCLLFATKWQLRRLMPESDPNSMMERVLLALVVSAGAFALILVLDKIEDLDSTGEDADRALVSVIGAMGILVGFSWEQSFGGAVEVFASLTDTPVTAQVVFAGTVALIVVPAWRAYIITKCEKAEFEYQRQPGKRRSRTMHTGDIKDLTAVRESLPQEILRLPQSSSPSSREVVYQGAPDDSPQH